MSAPPGSCRALVPSPATAATVIAVGLALVPWAAYAGGDPSLSGTVFNDLSGNQVFDAFDPGLVGWTVDLLDSSNAVVAATTSDASGHYSFSLPGSGAFSLQEILPAGWVATLPAASYAIPANTTQDMTGLDFGNFQLVSVSGFIYDDLDGNGQKGANEPGLPGRTADIEDGSGNILATTTSDATGDYTVTGVGPGSFTLHVETLPGETITQPTPPGSYNFTDSSGVNVVGGAFGLTGVTPTPEPLSFSVFGIALLGLGASRRARR